MEKIALPKFASYEEEAEFWDQLDTSEFMDDDGQWFRFETASKRALRVAILPEVAEVLRQRARSQGVTIETLVNACLIENMGPSAKAGK